MKIETGLVIREHDDEGYKEIGRIVHVDDEAYYWIPYPEKNEEGHRRHFIKAVRRSLKADIDEEVTSFVAFFAPATWSLTDEELQTNSVKNLSRKTRRKLHKWKQERDRLFKWIEPLFIDYKLSEILNTETLLRWAKGRKLELELKSHEPLVRAVRCYLLGGQQKNSLLPGWDASGGLGEPKLSSKLPGRKNVATAAGDKDKAAPILKASDRSKLHRGWLKYKRGKRSIQKALDLTHKEFYAKSVRHVSSTKVEVELLPENELPTIAQFRRHGPKGDPRLSATRIAMGQHKWERNHRPLKGTARDGLVAAGQMGLIDATPDDQTLASSASRLKMISSSHNTKVCEGATGYILGLHCGFEHPSTLTSLMAIAHAASPKEAYCKRYGIELKEGEWIQLSLKRIRADNGELKSEGGVKQLSDAEISAEFVRSYAAELKGPVESSHHSIARDSSHQMAASTQGKRHERGEERKEDSYCLTHQEYMPHLINSILRFNNEARVEHLLTMEMRNENVEPTRGAILKWMINKGYVASEPANLDQLRATCLPRLEASIYGDGVYIFDPRRDGRQQLVPKLRYWSQWLHDSGLTERGRKKVIPCTVGLNPSNLGEAWLHMDGLQRLDLKTKDPLMCEVTLLDWLLISDDDRLRAFLDNVEKHGSNVNHTASMDHTNKEAAEAKAQEVQDAPAKPSKAEQKAGKRAATDAERSHQNNVQLGVSGQASVLKLFSDQSNKHTYFSPDDEDWMDEIRKAGNQ